MSIEKKLTRLERQLKYRFEPLRVNIVIHGDGSLPESHINKGVHVSYIRFEEVADGHRRKA